MWFWSVRSAIVVSSGCVERSSSMKMAALCFQLKDTNCLFDIAFSSASRVHSPPLCSLTKFFRALAGSLLRMTVTSRSPYDSTGFPSDERLLTCSSMAS